MFNTTRTVSSQETMQIGNALGIDWNQVDISQFRRGLEVELEHGLVDKNSNVTNDDMLLTGKIALAHLNELSDYYTRLDMIENAKFNVSQNSDFYKPSTTLSILAGITIGAGAVLLTNYLKKKKSEN